jgi:hypothetical protein
MACVGLNPLRKFLARRERDSYALRSAYCCLLRLLDQLQMATVCQRFSRLSKIKPRRCRAPMWELQVVRKRKKGERRGATTKRRDTTRWSRVELACLNSGCPSVRDAFAVVKSKRLSLTNPFIHYYEGPDSLLHNQLRLLFGDSLKELIKAFFQFASACNNSDDQPLNFVLQFAKGTRDKNEVPDLLLYDLKISTGYLASLCGTDFKRCI